MGHAAGRRWRTAGAGALLGAALWLTSAPAPAQDIDDRHFLALAKMCAATAATPASPTAVRIGDAALAQHRAFRGSRVDNAGRITRFGSAEAESDRENEPAVTPEQIPWHQVLRYWEDLRGGRISGGGAHGALEVWFYPELTGDDPPPQVERRRVQLTLLLRAIEQLDFSPLGEDAPQVKAALVQSAIRASISDVAWSAAFIGAVMRQAGLAPSAFAYSSTHIRYIVAAIRQSLGDLDGTGDNHFFRACDPHATKPRVGDLYCYHRHVEGTRGPYRPRPGMSLFRSLSRDLAADPSVISRSHCDVVVRVDDASKKVITVGGNVHNSVSERTLNLNRAGVLSTNQGARPCAVHRHGNPKREESGCNGNSQNWFVLLQARS